MIKIWYQVFLTDKVFGFSVVDGMIIDCNEWELKGSLLVNTRKWFRERGASVVKICEQVIKD